MTMESGEKRSNCGRLATVLCGGTLALALATFVGGCSTGGGGSPSDAAGQSVELNFDLTKCQQVDQNMYKCPAIDKPICSPDYNPSGVECVRIGKKGSVFVMMPGGGAN